MNFYQQIVNHKINQITPLQLSQLADSYGISITAKEAELVIDKVKKTQINVFNDTERIDFLREIANITSPIVANQVEELFQKLTGQGR